MFLSVNLLKKNLDLLQEFYHDKTKEGINLKFINYLMCEELTNLVSDFLVQKFGLIVNFNFKERKFFINLTFFTLFYL